MTDQSVFLCILDGWGHREFDDNNALTQAHYWRKLLREHPHTFLNASEEFVGLPHGQMGNSEVGHMTIGLGRSLPQSLERINHFIENDLAKDHIALHEFINKIKTLNNRCHIVGLFSDGGVHSHQDHFMFFSKYLMERNIHVFLHPILDGRDTSQKAALNSINLLDDLCRNNPLSSYGTLGGRYYAMDRDKRWDRTQKAYDCITKNNPDDKSPQSYKDAVLMAYNANITDEFIEPTSIHDYQGLQDQDSFLFINFRADRMIQLLTVLTDPCFKEFQTRHFESANIATMTNYSNQISSHVSVLFDKINLSNGLGEILSKNNIKQFRAAETEKYAHVTYFFNGGVEEPFPNEDRLLIPSPKVATYDLQPEMSADLITESIVTCMEEHKYHFILSNFANPDMVGHTGVKKSIIQSVQKIDQCLERLVTAAFKNNWIMIITADHGNVETLIEESGQPHTAHTTNLVPFMIINAPKKISFHTQTKTLADIAPTVLDLLQIDKPSVMEGNCMFMNS